MFVSCQSVSMRFEFWLQMALEIRSAMHLPFALALSKLHNFISLKLLCMVSNILHSSVSVCGCTELEIWRAERE